LQRSIISALTEALYLDLEDSDDRNKLAEASLFVDAFEDRLVILDEIHRMPDLFDTLRGVIDRGRRNGKGRGRFLILGSASIDLLRQSETLAGRIAFVEMTPLTAMEVADDRETRERLWTMLAHGHGTLLNASELARGLNVSAQSVSRYVDLLCDLLLVRRLPPLNANLGKRLVRSPKVYVRDSGLVHALLGIESLAALSGHPVVGPSWEGYVIETLLAACPLRAGAYFYRTTVGAEIDLVVDIGGGRLWAVEIKRAASPKLARGFHQARADLKPERAFAVHAAEGRYPIAEGVEAIGLSDLAREFAMLSS
jgi:uncharacterized protein